MYYINKQKIPIKDKKISSLRRIAYGLHVIICFMLFNLSEARTQSRDYLGAAERPKTVLTGEVLSRKNATPLESVSIRTKSGVYVGRTGTKGHFEFSVPSGVNVLLFSRVGYKSLEYNIDQNPQNRIQIILDTLENILDEAVVIGYGSTTRRLSTGSVRSEEHTSELQSRENLVCRLLLEKKKQQHQ